MDSIIIGGIVFMAFILYFMFSGLKLKECKHKRQGTSLEKFTRTSDHYTGHYEIFCLDCGTIIKMFSKEWLSEEEAREYKEAHRNE